VLGLEVFGRRSRYRQNMLFFFGLGIPQVGHRPAPPSISSRRDKAAPNKLHDVDLLFGFAPFQLLLAEMCPTGAKSRNGANFRIVVATVPENRCFWCAEKNPDDATMRINWSRSERLIVG
jgi:hypothetical protein